MDLLTAFGVKRGTRRPKRKKPRTSTKILGRIMIGNRKKKLYRGKKGGVYYRTRSGRVYVNMKKLRRKGKLYMLRRKKSSRTKGRKTRYGIFY